MDSWTDLCPPAQIYLLFMIALVLFDLVRGSGQYAVRHMGYGLFGTIALWVLCAANMDFAAWGLLLLPLFFFVVLIALWVFDGVLFTTGRKFQGGKSFSRFYEQPILVTKYECKQPLGSGQESSCT